MEDISSRSVRLANIHNNTEQYRKTHESVFGKRENPLLYVELKKKKKRKK